MCDGIVISWVVVLILEELISIESITMQSATTFLLTLIAVEVPIPTDKSGLTFKDIWSPTFNWWDVDTETTDDILSIFALTWDRFDSIE